MSGTEKKRIKILIGRSHQDNHQYEDVIYDYEYNSEEDLYLLIENLTTTIRYLCDNHQAKKHLGNCLRRSTEGKYVELKYFFNKANNV